MTKTLLVALLGCLLWCVPVSAEGVVSSARIMTLNAATVKQLEARLKVPGGRPLSDYVRYYTLTGDYESPAPGSGIWGVFLSKESRKDMPGAHIVPIAQMPRISDGGCSVIELYFDFQMQDFTRLKCHGYA